MRRENGWYRRVVPERSRLEGNRWLRWAAPWLGHPALWRWSRRGVALGVALGIFFGLLVPLAQIPLSAAAAIVLRANLPAAAASTLITNPVTFAPLYYAAWRLGSWATGDTSPPGVSGPPALAAEATWVERIAALGKPLLVGLTLMAVVSGVSAYALVSLLWAGSVRRRRRAGKTVKNGTGGTKNGEENRANGDADGGNAGRKPPEPLR